MFQINFILGTYVKERNAQIMSTLENIYKKTENGWDVSLTYVLLQPDHAILDKNLNSFL